jgi:hypothetical protein
MPIPSELLTLAKSRRFWTDFFWITETVRHGYPELADCRVELPLPDGSRMLLLLDKALCYFSLQFAAPGSEPIEIAWDDQAHWHPDVLQWRELEAICRFSVIRDPEISHPGILLLLLQRFAPICVGDDVDRIVALLETAWRRLDLFSANEIRELIERTDARDAEFSWQREESTGNWYLTQERDIRGRGKALYTLRTPKGAFPFSVWRAAFEAVEAELHVRGDSERAPEPGTVQLRQSHLLNLTLPLQDSQRPLPTAAGYFFRNTLARLFESRGMGTANSSGAHSQKSADGTYVTTEEFYSVQLKGDLIVGLRLMRESLWWAKYPSTTMLRSGYADTIQLTLFRQMRVVFLKRWTCFPFMELQQHTP